MTLTCFRTIHLNRMNSQRLEKCLLTVANGTGGLTTMYTKYLTKHDNIRL